MQEIVEKLLNKIEKDVTKITTEDLRLYLAQYKKERGCKAFLHFRHITCRLNSGKEGIMLFFRASIL